MDQADNPKMREPDEGLAAEVTHVATPEPGNNNEDRKTDAEQEDVVQGALINEISQCEMFIDQDQSLERAKATRYYRGDYFGDEEEGRSQIVMPIVRDVIRATLPGLMKTFFGGQNIVEFAAAGNAPSPDASDDATDATATVNHVILKQNDGWTTIWGVFKDALRGRTGWLTWWYDKSKVVTACTYSRVSEQQMQMYAAAADDNEDIQVVSKVQVGTNQVPGQPVPTAQQDPQTGQVVTVMAPGPPQQVPVYEYTLRVITKKPKNQVCIDSVPPEEIIYSRESASIDGHRAPRLIGRRRLVTQSFCVGLGITEDFLEKNAGISNALSMNPERLARQPNQAAFGPGNAEGTDDQRFITLYDLYYRIDQDQDGISELRHIIAVGDNKAIWSNEYANDVQLALFCPDPEPHLMVGLGQSDSTMDLQQMWSHVMRDVLDSLKLSIFPRTAYVEGQANVDDILNTEMGGAIRMRAPGMVTPFTHEFAGQKAFPLFDLFDGIQERRTGIGAATQGMDGSALQSTTAAAANQSMAASQQQVELIARIFAETGMKRLFNGVYTLLKENQDHEMQFRLNGRDYKVSPQKWGAMEVVVDTGLGLGSQEVKLQALTAHVQDIKVDFGAMGMNNPLSSLQELYNTKKRIFEIAGIRDIQRFMRDPKLAEQNGATVQAPVSPEQTVADAEVKIKGRVEDRETLKIILEDDREREKQIADEYLEAANIQGQWGVPVDVAHIKLLQEREKSDAAHILAAQALNPTTPAPSTGP